MRKLNNILNLMTIVGATAAMATGILVKDPYTLAVGCTLLIYDGLTDGLRGWRF